MKTETKTWILLAFCAVIVIWALMTATRYEADCSHTRPAGCYVLDRWTGEVERR